MAITRTVLPCIALLCSLAPAASAATLTFEDPDGDKYGTFVLTATESGGNDRLLGGPDEDELVGGEGAQELRGGTENDTIDGDFFAVAYGGDVIDGGPGTDTGGGRYRPSDEESTPPISVTQDGAANDGREGEQDDVTSIERISTGGTTGAFHGTEGADEFKLHLRRGSTTRLYGGDDRFDGANSAETVDGGAGADDLRGGFGHDTITGGPGQDVIDGDGGSYCHLWGCSVPYGNDVCCRVSGRLLLGGRAVATGTTALLEAGTATVVLRVTAKARRRLRRLRGARLKLRVAPRRRERRDGPLHQDARFQEVAANHPLGRPMFVRAADDAASAFGQGSGHAPPTPQLHSDRRGGRRRVRGARRPGIHRHHRG